MVVVNPWETNVCVWVMDAETGVLFDACADDREDEEDEACLCACEGVDNDNDAEEDGDRTDIPMLDDLRDEGVESDDRGASEEAEDENEENEEAAERDENRDSGREINVGGGWSSTCKPNNRTTCSSGMAFDSMSCLFAKMRSGASTNSL